MTPAVEVGKLPVDVDTECFPRFQLGGGGNGGTGGGGGQKKNSI